MKKTRVITIEMTPEEVQERLLKYLKTEENLPIQDGSVSYTIREVGGDPLDRYPGTNKVVGISVKYTHEIDQEEEE